MFQELLELDYSFGLQKLQIYLDKIKQDLTRANQAIKAPADELYEYIANLKREVQLNTELKIKNITDLSADLMKQIDKFEKECKESMKQTTNIELDSIESQLKSINEFHDKCSNNLKEKEISKESIKKIIDKAKAFQSNLKLNLNTLRSKIFRKDSLLDFEPNLNNLTSDSIGYFSFERYSFTDFDKLTRIALKSRLKTSPNNSNFQMALLDNGNYIIAYPTYIVKGYNRVCITIISLISKDLEFIREIKLDFHDSFLTLNCYKNLLAVNIRSDKGGIEIYDENLFLRDKISFENESNSLLTFDDDYIYQYLNKRLDKNYSRLKVYNLNLEKVNTIIIHNYSNESFYYLPPSASQIELYDSKFYYQIENSINIVNKTDGKLIKSINNISEKHNFVINKRKGYLIALNKDSDKLLYFTLMGDLFYESEMIMFSSTLSKLIFKNKIGLAFFDSNSSTLIYEAFETQ